MTFRFDEERHWYFDDRGRRVKHITQLMEDEGLVDPTFYTAGGRTRGRDVHDLCKIWDLGALDLELIEGSPYAGYLAAWQAASAVLKPTWEGVEVAWVHSRLRFGGRPDRYGKADVRRPTVLELKTGAPHTKTGIQLALQAILVEDQTGLPAKRWRRMVVYLKPTGKFRTFEYPDLGEIEEAYRIIRKHCR